MKYNFTLFFIIGILNLVTGQTLDATLVELNFHEDSDPQDFTSSQSGFYFTATDGYYNKFGRELWHSDGTKEGTIMIRDIKNGQNSSNPASLIYINNLLYFTANDGFHGTELWKSDGTESGTLMVKDITPNNDSEYNGPWDLVSFNGKLYFTATNGIDGYELWTSDGIESGTYMVKDINPLGDSRTNDLFTFNNNLYFTANDGENGIELWKSDGTESGTVMVKNINSNSSGLNPGNDFLVMGNNFYFLANDGIKGNELWKSDGTELGTQIVKDIGAGNNFSWYTLKGAVLDNMIIFEFNDGINGTEIWKSDGNESGTLMIKNINNSNGSSIVNSKYINFNNEIYFLADDNIHGNEIWKTDGTPNGTILLKDINNGSLSVWIEKFHIDKTNNKLLFYTTSTNSSERKLWVSNGTSNGTFQLSDIEDTPNSDLKESFVTVNNVTFLTGQNETYGNEIWQTDGTVSGTILFADLNHSNNSSPSKFTNVNGNLFFRAQGKEYGSQLFKSDGTIKGTQLIKDINPGYNSIDDLSDMKAINGTLFFSAVDGTHGYELWKSDGTENGTVLVKDINPGTKSSLQNYNDKQEFAVMKDILYFNANNGINGFELWRSNGSESGTYMIKDLNLGSEYNYSSYPRKFTLLNNKIYFIAHDANNGTSLWTTDGTAAGTVQIKSLNDMRVLKTVNNKLIIIAETSGTTYGPHDLWVSDGTAAGTSHIKTFGDNIDSDIQFTTILNNDLYFVAKSPDSFRKAIYKTDGTIAGTVLLFDGANHPTMPDLDIDTIISCGNYVYFGVQTYYGTEKELWRTNGQITEKIAGPDTADFLAIRDLTCYNENLLYLAEMFPKKIWLINDYLSSPVDLNINVTNGQNFTGYNSIEALGATANNLYFSGRNDISGNELYITQINPSSLGISNPNNSDNTITEKITFYPNPASEFVNIKSPDQEIIKFELWDLNGKKIDERLNKDFKKEIKYDVRRLQKGLYFFKITLSNGNVSNLKLIISNK